MITALRKQRDCPKSFYVSSIVQIACLLGALAFPIYLNAQNANSNANANANSASPSPSPTPIPVSGIVSEADRTTARMSEIRTFLETRPDNFRIVTELTDIGRRLDPLGSELESILAGRTTLEELNDIETRTQSITRTVGGWTSTLQAQAGELEERLKEARALRGRWELSIQSLSGVQTGPGGEELIPPQAIRRSNEVVFGLGELIKQIERRRADIIDLQAKVSETETRAQAMLLRIRERRNAALENLFAISDVPIWQAEGWSTPWAQTAAKIQASISGRWIDLREYVQSNAIRFVIHGILIVLLALGLSRAAKTLNPMAATEPKLERAAVVFNRPTATSVMLSILLSGLIYPAAPRILMFFLGVAIIVPAVYLLRKLIDRPISYVLYALAVLYVLDRVRELFSVDEFSSRMIFLIEMLLAGAFFFWFYRSKKIAARVPAGDHRLFNRVRQIALIATILITIAFIGNLGGFTNLSEIVGTGILRSAYAALIFYALYEVTKGLVMFALRVRPLSSLLMVRNNRTIIRIRVMQIVRFVLVLVWLLLALRALSVNDLVFGWIGAILSASFTIGSLTFSIGHIVGFVAAVWIAFMLSRFLRFVLEEDLYPRVGITGGVSYAVSTMVHYAVLVAGFLLAIAALGFELSQFAFIAGAVGIGIGFGLQNIINNFVSGLILLFERPVKVGDTVQIAEHTGSLQHIGLRASILRKVDGSDVIVPNSQLISEEVVNWTMSDEKRRIDIPVGVAYGTDPKTVLDLLTRVGTQNADIMNDPAPRAIFSGFGESSLDFELRAWTAKADDWVPIRSDLVTGVYAALTEAGIEIPFPQRDLNLRGEIPIKMEDGDGS